MSLLTMEPSVEHRLQKGIAHKIEGRYEDAEREFRAILDGEPDNAVAHMELGRVFVFTGMFDESIQELQRCVELAPSFVPGRVELALTYAMLGMNDEAKQELETALELDPTNEAALRHIQYFR